VGKCFWNDIHRCKLHARINEEKIKFRSQKLLSSRCITDRKIKRNKTILSIVLCGYETWYLTFITEYWLRIFKYRMLMKIFGSKREQVMWGYREQHKQELLYLCSSPNIVRMIE
jgi:hypothetical protein